MINRRRPHVFVLPEDRANSQLADGFLLDLDPLALTKIQVLQEAGGWQAVLKTFESDHVAGMDLYTERFMILLIDFDRDEGRAGYAKRSVPERLKDRVFILGALTEPEDLKRAGLGHYEAIGRALSEDCREGTDNTWGHDLLRHNANEITRLRQHVRQILFQHI
jgi:hypothetical protein